MYEDVRELWKRYCATRSHLWAQPDARGYLAAEVENRLEQLDLTLELLRQASAALNPDPEQTRRDQEYFMQQFTRFDSGEVNHSEYEALIMARPPRIPADAQQSWSKIRLFTETFYFVAWRIREILNASGPNAFSDLGKISARGIRDVRNHLLQHPDRARPSQKYEQSLMFTDDGPVLKSTAFMIKKGRVSADPDSLDRGLFWNARQLRDELHLKLTRILA